MSDKNPWINTKTSKEETQSAIEDFLANGGEITRLNDDDGAYDRHKESAEKRLGGSFNPFSKTEALTKK